MRQTTAEVRLDEGKAASCGASEASELANDTLAEKGKENHRNARM
jgi:hypothetical protein